MSETPKCEDCGFTLVKGELDRSGQEYWCPVCAKAGIRLEENKRLRLELADCKEDYLRRHKDVGDMMERAITAETKLAAALKATPRTLIEQLRDITPSDSGYVDLGREAAERIENLEAQRRVLQEQLAAALKAKEEAEREARKQVWLIEVSHSTNPRWFWGGGDSWNCDPLKAVRFTTKEAAKETAQKIYGEFLWLTVGTRIEICDHIFNLPTPRPAIDEAMKK